MFDKVKELNKMRKQAIQIQRQLKEERVEVIEDGVRVVMTGNQEIEKLEIDNVENKRVSKVVNKAIKKSQKLAAKKLQEMRGGLKGLLGGMR